MNYIKGNFRQAIYNSKTGYLVGLFKIKETNDSEMTEYLNKTITFTGNFINLNKEELYIFYGKYVFHERYGWQYQVNSYEIEEPQDIDSVTAFLASPLIQGSGDKTAKKIVKGLGKDALSKIRENYQVLLTVPGISDSRAQKIYTSLMAHRESEETLIFLTNNGFSLGEGLRIINEFKTRVKEIITENIYELMSIIDFNKLDSIFLKNHDLNDKARIKAATINAMQNLSFNNGDTYLYFNEIYQVLTKTYHISQSYDELYSIIGEIPDIIIDDEKYFLREYDEAENYIAVKLNNINSVPSSILITDEMIKQLEKKNHITYAEEQRKAIVTALNNNITIITGGPGTGKTTIIDGIVKLYREEKKLDNIGLLTEVALLAPTGRASKKLAEATNLKATTIHRYLKWNKETNEYAVNEHHKANERLIIIDEVSMIDTLLMAALLKALHNDVKIILVGDHNQLPSVGPGNVLEDLINSDVFPFIYLKKIYRQSDNSYIAFLAKEIKECSLSDFTTRKDDYNFFTVNDINIKDTLRQICQKGYDKGINEKNVQILVPLYKGENGIDNLNIIVRDIFNPLLDKNTIRYGDTTYRENDKVLQLVNNPDMNVYNGDIGFIENIFKKENHDEVTINFDGNRIVYKKEDLRMINLAYVISIHKSQGSEFDHVIMPVTNAYHKMLYNRLLYTGVSRAKKTLTIIGSQEAFLSAVNNTFSIKRKTFLKERLIHNIN